MAAVRSLSALVALLVPLLAHAGTLADLEVYDRTLGTSLADPRAQGPAVCRRRAADISTSCASAIARRRLLAVTSVDGVNVVSGETAAQHQSGYVLDAWDSVAIEGWRKSLDEVATFYFTRLADSYAARTGRPHDVGVIGVALFREQPHTPAAALARSQTRTQSTRSQRQARRSAERDAAGAATQRAAPQRLEARHGSRRSRSLAGAVRGFPPRLVDA